MKKTYIPSTPRSRKLKSVGGGTINVSGGSAQNVPVIEGHTHDNKIILDAITQLHLRILSSLNVDEDGALIVELSNIIKELDATVPTDENLFSALRTVLEIRARSISKTDPDTAQEIIKFVKGIEIGTFTTGPLGAGASLKMENGVSRLEVDQLDVRMRATFRELIIESLKHIGGQLILSPARMKCNKVVDGGTYYKCYFDTGDGKVSNEFVAGDQARCQVFTGSGVKMYWRLVTSVGTDWINLSKTDAISGSSIPEAGDDIVQLGNRSDATRQNAQILSTVGSDAPSWKQYKGINAFSLEGKDTTVFSGTGNKIDGKTVFMSSGANVEDGINSKNSNYSSQPTSYKANDTWTLSADTTVNGIAYKAGEILTATQDSTTYNQAHWVKKVRYTDQDAINKTVGDLQIGGRNFVIQTQLSNTFFSALDGNLSTSANVLGSQKQLFESDKLTVKDFTGLFKVTISYYDANGTFLTSTYIQKGNVYIDSFPETRTVPIGTKLISYTIIKSAGGTFTQSESSSVKIKIEKGNKPTDWTPAPEDVDAKIADTKLYVEYSTNGTSWHTTFQANDVYMRQKTGVNGTWTGAIKIVGKDGTSVSIKGKVATSASLPGSASLGDGYIAEDTGHLWVWTGSWTDAGKIQGDNGANSYIHIAYADDSLGAGFSHNPSGKSWIGIYADFAAIDSDTPSDYTWMYAKGQQGEQGVSISSITPKYAVSTDGVNPPISWSNTVPAKAWNEYMWQYEIIAYSNNTTFETSKRVVSGINGADGASGADGADGADGISILSVTPEYAVNSNNATAPTTFYTTPPSRAAGQYLWVREKIEYSSGDPSYTSARVVTGDKGDTGASAPLLYLSASAQVIKCNPDNTPQAGQTISIEAKLQNVLGTATFVATPYNDAGTALTTITLGGSGNTRTLTNAQWLATYKRIEVVATLGSLTDKVTIYRVADGATGKGISGTEIKYQVGASGTTAPTGTWLTSVPTVLEGQFLWTRTITSYTDSTSTTSYSVSKQGVSGSDGKGISSTVITYQSSSSGTVVPTGTWTEAVPSVSENQFLWTRTVITYTDSSASTSYSVGKMGAKGDAGQNAIVGLLTNESVTLQANNAGIVSSFTPANGEFWVYNGTTKVTSGITFSKVSQTGCTAAITSAGVYSVSAMSADNATVVLRAVYSGVTIDKVLTLSKSRAGADGVSISLVDVEFAKNTDAVNAPTTGWSTTAPTLATGEQLWTRTKTSYSSGSPTYSTPANITPKTGATGTGIDSVTEEYAISTSKTVQPTTGWSTTQPAWIQGQYIWSRVKVVYKNPASTVYTGYAVSSEWEAINDLQIGGRNYIIKSQLTNSFFSAVSGIQTSLTSVLGSQKQSFESDQLTVNDFTGLFMMTINYYDINEIFLTSTYIQNGNTYIETFPLTTTVPTGTKFISYTIVKKSGGTFPPSESNTLKLKLEKGSKATDWTEAPEDVQAAIDAEKTRINEILSDNIADPSEKQYLSNLWQEIYAEYPRIWAQANTYAVDKSTYETKYSALNTLLSPVLANLTVNTAVSGASIRTAFSQYYDARTFLLNNITNKVNQNAGDAKLTAEQAQLAADGYIRARYVRDWAKGNTVNNNNNWAEIKVFNKAGVNIALGKIPSTDTGVTLTNPSYATDNNTGNNANIINTNPNTENWIKIDLGSIVYDIDYIQIWHWLADGRTYYGTKTEISVDGVNWTPVFDSAKSGTYKETAAGNIISLRPNEVLAKVLKGAAVTDTFKTTINGGLISTVMILLRELNSIIETAGISGIQDDGYLPAYWSGGTYAEALAFSDLMRAVDRGDNPIASATLNAKMSSIVMLHNGHAKVGELIVKSNGQIIVLDKATGKIKFIINSQDIPSVADLMSGTAFGESKTNPSVSGITGIVTLQNTISVDKNNSTLSFAADISLTLRNYTKIADASMSVDLFKNGVLYLNLGSLSVVKLDESTTPVTDSYSISKTISGIPTGTYSVKITVVASGDVMDYAGSISTSTLAWNFTQSGVRYFQLGLDGLMAFYSDNHFHYTETGGLDVRGATNMPGVLASGSSSSSGAHTNVWGAKSNTAGITPITGGFRVPLKDLSHANYVVQITAHTNTTFRVDPTKKTTTSFEVYGTGGFDYVVTGNNY